MRKLILLFVIFICRIAYAKNRIEEYFDLTNEAELLISSDKKEQALQHYDMAFSINATPLGKDLLNALICSYQANDTSKFKKYAWQLQRNGAFSAESNLKKYLAKISDGPDRDMYNAIWGKLQASVKSSVDTSYRNQLIKLVQQDQDVRHYFVQKFNGDYNRGGKDSLNVFDSLNVIKLSKLFSSNGFPSEARVGYDHDFPGNPPIYELIIRHDRSWTNRKTLDSLFHEEVLIGHFPAITYGYWKDQSYGNKKDSIASYQRVPYARFGTDALTIINDTLYVEKFTEPVKKHINNARVALFMNSLGQEAVKAKYQLKHKYYRFLDGTTFAQWDGVPPEEIEIMKNKSYNETEVAGFNSVLKTKCKYGLEH